MSLCGLGISCEPAPCEHGKYLRQEQCHLCEIHRQIMALTDMYKSLSIRVVGQHDHKLRQIDENRKVSKRIDDLEQLIYDEKSKLREKDKKPYKCPVCEGTGYWHKMTNNIGSGGTCNTCQAKGIVWG